MEFFVVTRVTMTHRSRKRLLVGIHVALAAGFAATFAAALQPTKPSQDLALGHAGGELDGSGTATEAVDMEPASAYAVIYQHDVRRPLYDPPPVKVAKPKPRQPKLTIQLTGTVIEPGSAVGLFRTSDSRHKFAGVGDSVEGAEVLSVVAGSATVRFEGRTFTLDVPRKGAD